MAFTVTTDFTTIDDAESASTWSTGAVDGDFFVQNTYSIAWNATKNGRRSNTVTPAATKAWSTGDHIYFWWATSVAAKAENKTTGTTTASGMTVRVTLANSAYREWHVAGADTWDGAWKCFVIDMAHTGTQLYASSGTFSSSSNIASVTYYIDLTNSGNIRNADNNWMDVVRVGTGLRAYNTTAVDAAFDLADIAAQDEAVANRYGVLETKDGIIYSQGKVTVGDGVGGNHVDFDSQDEVLVFSERNGSGSGLVADGLYELNFAGNATGTDQNISIGVKVGTGDTATARNGTLVLAGGSAVRFTMDWNDADLHIVTLYGMSVRGGYSGTSGDIAIQAGSPTTTHEVIGCTFDGCGQIDFQDATCRDILVLNSGETGSTYGAILWDETDSDIKNSLFVNNTNVFEVRDGVLTANMSFDGMEFSGNTYDVRYEDTVDDFYLDWQNASGAPSIQNAGAGTLTARNTVTLTVNVKESDGTAINGARVRIQETDGTLISQGSTNASGVYQNTSYEYTADTDVEVRVRLSPAAGTRYYPTVATGQIVSTGFTTTVTLIEDTLAA